MEFMHLEKAFNDYCNYRKNDHAPGFSPALWLNRASGNIWATNDRKNFRYDNAEIVRLDTKAEADGLVWSGDNIKENEDPAYVTTEIVRQWAEEEVSCVFRQNMSALRARNFFAGALAEIDRLIADGKGSETVQIIETGDNTYAFWINKSEDEEEDDESLG